MNHWPDRHRRRALAYIQSRLTSCEGSADAVSFVAVTVKVQSERYVVLLSAIPRGKARDGTVGVSGTWLPHSSQ